MTRSLWPREHGAYGQLGAPLVAALACAPPTAPAVALAGAAVFALFANEPLLVVLGHRGARARAELGPRARRRLAILSVPAAALAGFGFAALDTTGRLAIALAAIPAAALVALAWRRRQRSLAGELIATIGFPAAAAPVMVAAHQPLALALAVWLAWSLGLAATILAVHRVLARHRHPRAWPDTALTVALVAAILSCLILPTPLARIPLPLCVAALALVLRPPRATHLRAIGFTLLAAAAVTVGLVLVLVR